ncbi:MAG: hypothetical protein H6619_03825 [Deltaproteobacteria bacterium]|nr:hypothetical protein [Deltaproteobacteria bacterium]
MGNAWEKIYWSLIFIVAIIYSLIGQLLLGPVRLFGKERFETCFDFWCAPISYILDDEEDECDDY